MPLVSIVNDDDGEITGKERAAVRYEDIYRVSALWATDLNGRILLAKRSPQKAHSPGLWAGAVAGTVEFGETYEQNIRREIEEELGISADRVSNLQLGPKVRVRDEHNYFGQWFTGILSPDEDFRLQAEEVSEIRWFDPDELQLLLQRQPELFIHQMGEWAGLFL